MFLEFIFKRNKKIQKKINKKSHLNDWMDLTKEERLEQDFNDKNESMRKKKALLKTIREEYIKIKKKKK